MANDSQPDHPDYITAAEVVTLSGLSRYYVDYLRSRDAESRGLSGPPFDYRYGKVRYKRTDVLQWLAQRIRTGHHTLAYTQATAIPATPSNNNDTDKASNQ
jgi:predicted DNA-binding transcriptional regulator AlpA